VTRDRIKESGSIRWMDVRTSEKLISNG